MSRLVVMLAAGQFIQTAVAQPANDNFVNAQLLPGDFGTLDADTTGATAEPGEPNHAGYPASASVWYKWQPTVTGQVQIDTLNSGIDTVLAVYTAPTAGTDISTLNFLVANDDINSSYSGLSLPWIGPSGVRFNAQEGVTYYIAVDGYMGEAGPIELSWAYRSAGVFRFTADFAQCGERESGGADASCAWSPAGMLVTITRDMGSVGRVAVSVSTLDGSAVAGTDYMPVNATLIFDDFEMSKTIVIPIIYSPTCMPNRQFSVAITSVVLDPLEVEADSVLLPRVNLTHGETVVEILDANESPNFPGIMCPVPNNVNFRRSHCRTVEGIGTATVWVDRLGAGADPRRASEIHYSIDSLPPDAINLLDNIFQLAAGSDYATPNPPTDPWYGVVANFEPVTGTLSWGDGDRTPKPINIPIYDNLTPGFNLDLRIKLFSLNHNNDDDVGNIGEMTLTILYDDYPAGGLDAAHNPDFNIGTNPPRNSKPGVNGVVYSIAVQPDDKSIVAGHFSTYNTVARNGIARANVDGSLDTYFNPGSGVAVQQGDFISSAVLMPDGKVIIGGSFSSFNGIPRYRIARLNSNGSLDTSFSPGLGADATVWSVAVQSDGKVIIGGEFTSINGTNRSYVARLNDDGSLDTSFDPSLNSPNGYVQSVAVAASGQTIIGGSFTALGDHSRNGVARLNENGTLDASFDPGTGVDGPVYVVALQGDGRVLAGGAFDHAGAYSRQNLVRFNSNGAVDLGFDTGSGVDDSVYSITLQADGAIYLGGVFTSINGTRRVGVARLFASGEVDTGWLDTAYNQFAGPYKTIYNRAVNPKDFLFATALQSDGKLMIGGSFSYVGGGRRTSEVQTNMVSPIDLQAAGYSRATFRSRANVARLLGGSTVGPGSTGLVVSDYDANENMGFLYVKLVRENGTLGPIQSTFSLPPRPAGPGVAQSGVDYVYNRVNDPQFWSSWLMNTRMLSDGVFGTNNDTRTVVTGLWDNATYDDVYVTLNDRPGIQGDRTVPFQLSTPSMSDVFYLGGENIPVASALARTEALLTIAENDVRPGAIGFSVASYSVNENGTNAIITLTRTNGSFGRVTVRFATTNGTAVAGVDYVGVTNTVTFDDGIISRTVSIPIKNDLVIQPADRTVNLYLATPGNGATLGLTNATLFIVDDDYSPGRINLSPDIYSTNETAGTVTLAVTRTGGNAGIMDVQYRTVNGTAISGVNYTGVTNALHWNSGDSATRFINVPVIHDGLVTPDKTFQAQLFSPKSFGTNAPQAFGPRTNANVTIVNEDFYGTFQFTTGEYFVGENGGYATVTIQRINGSAENVTVNYSTYDNGGGAVPDVNYGSTNGTLFFGPGEIAKSFNIPIFFQAGAGGIPPYYSIDFGVALTGLVPSGALIGPVNPAVVHIVNPELVTTPAGSVDPSLDTHGGMNNDVYALALQPGGKIVAGGNFTTVSGANYNRLVRLEADGTLDESFLYNLAGANAAVRTLISQTDNRVVIGGAFTTVDGVNRSHIARLNYDGSLDTGFNPGSGPDNQVYSLAETWVKGERKILLGGAFASFNGTGRNCIARLNDDGTLDLAFKPGLGANGIVYALAAYPTNTVHGGKVLIGGDFTSINGTPYSRIARLNVDGTVDATFNPGSGADAAVRAIAIQADGGILIGGSFTNVNTFANANGIARLNPNGSIDPTFIPQPGANGTVFAIAMQADQRILLVGEFTTVSGVTRHRITRLQPNGKVDPTINFGLGANNFVNAIVVQNDQHMVIGGGFTEFNGTPMNRIGRIFGGSLTGSGSFEFTSPAYSALQSQTNTFISVRRLGGTSGLTPGGSVSVLFATSDGTAISGEHYVGVTNTLVFPEGEVFMQVSIVVSNNLLIESNRTVNLTLSDPLPPGGPELGPQPTATLTIINDNSAVSFFAATYTTTKGNIDNAASIRFVRTGYLDRTAVMDFMTTTNGTALPGVDYVPVTNLITFLPGQASVITKVMLGTNNLVRGSQTVGMTIKNSSGALLLDPIEATLTIVDTSTAAGKLTFSAPSYSALEDEGSATITVLRTNGHTGIVTVKFLTLANTAVPYVDYIPTNGTLTFGDGETSKSFAVPVINDGVVGSDKYLVLMLTNATGGAAISGSATAPMTVVENNRGFNLSSPVYVSNENDGNVTVTVRRIGSTNGFLSVNLSTTNGTAIAGVDYAPINGVLTFQPGETIKPFAIPVTFRPGIQGDRTFFVLLSTNSLTPGANIGDPAVATVYILDQDTGFYFTNDTFSVLKSATNLLVTVMRTNPNTGAASVMYATSDGTARGGIHYTPVLGTLAFNNGEQFRTFTVPILSNSLVEGDLTFNLNLTSASTNASLVSPSNAVATIVDDNAGFRFSAANYVIAESGVRATIDVFRENYTNSTVSVDFKTLDGTAKAGQDYVATNGTLVFTNGVTHGSFNVTIIDNTIIQGNHSVLLSLANPVGASALVNPSAATLTILDNDGSLISPAGSALIVEGLGKTNGIIDPGETVTMLLALRNTIGADTTNITATLLATNGITLPSGPQNYGALIPDGASASRPFTFTAAATNGQHIVATLSLRQGALSLGTATFVYTVGNVSTSFTNNTPIIIPSYGAASPYPATNAVAGLDGVVSQMSLSLTNLYHRFPSDINMLLVSPAGQKVVVMGAVGGSVMVTNLYLTLDDSGTNVLPFGATLTNGTYRPANYRPLFDFGSFPPAPAMPYSNALSAFNGGNPNGTWSLYVVDSQGPDDGSIGAWWLTVNTANPVVPSCDVSLKLLAAPASAVLTSNITYTLIVTNHGPGTASSVTVTDDLPVGVSYVSALPSVGSATTSGAGQVTWRVGALPINATASMTLLVKTTLAGQLTNAANATLAQTDPNLVNNYAVVVSTVTAPVADLALGLVDSPDPVYLTNAITYSVGVTNLGPATATGVTLTNVIPDGVVFVPAASSPFLTNQGGILTGNLGTMASGAQTFVTIVLRPTMTGTITNTVGVFSPMLDPLKGNNVAAVKTVATLPLILLSRAGNNLVLAWPAEAAGYSLKSATNLVPRVIWTPVPVVPVVIGGAKTVTIPITTGSQYFRLDTAP